MSKNDADTFYKQGKYIEAIDIYSKLLEKEPNLSILSNRSLAYFKLKDYDKMLTDCVECVKIDKNNGKCWGRLGGALYHFKRYDEAYQAYCKALILDKNEKYTKMINRIINIQSKILPNNIIDRFTVSVDKFIDNNKLFLQDKNINDDIFLSNKDVINKIMNKLEGNITQEFMDKITNNPLSIINDNMIQNLMSDILENIKL